MFRLRQHDGVDCAQLHRLETARRTAEGNPGFDCTLQTYLLRFVSVPTGSPASTENPVCKISEQMEGNYNTIYRRRRNKTT
jgi:hypothetical protein